MGGTHPISEPTPVVVGRTAEVNDEPEDNEPDNCENLYGGCRGVIISG